MKRKWPTVDILKLYSGTYTKNDNIYKDASWDDTVITTRDDKARFKAHKKWNRWLSLCLKTRNLSELMKMLYGLQAGMDDLAKKNMATPEIVDMWIRWCRSIEKTATKIIILKNPIPMDGDQQKVALAKKQRNAEIEKFLMESAF